MTTTRRPLKALATVAASAAILVLGAGAASAQTTGQTDGYYYGQQAAGDCVVTADLDKATQFSWKVFGVGNVSCSYRHSSTTITTYLKASDGSSSWTQASAQSTFSNSYGTGSRWLYTTQFSCNPRLYYQTVVTASVSGIGSFYATTGAPRKVC